MEDKLVDDETMGRIKDRVLYAIRQFAPTHISRIETTYENKNGILVIHFNVPLVEGQKDARAQEFGSGIHSTRNFKSPNQLGIGSKILIKPVKAFFLAFDWQVTSRGEAVDKQQLRNSAYNAKRRGDEPYSNSFQTITTSGKLLFNYVLHPGIKPYYPGGYLKSALDYAKASSEKELMVNGIDAIIMKLRRTFPRK